MKYLAILVMVLVAGCGVDKSQWDKCEGLCKNNDSINWVKWDGSCFCNNKAKFINE